jgi:hypothetical protein
MATQRKKVITYLPQDLFIALETWQQHQGISSLSGAVVTILQHYLFPDSQEPSLSVSDPISDAPNRVEIEAWVKSCVEAHMGEWIDTRIQEQVEARMGDLWADIWTLLEGQSSELPQDSPQDLGSSPFHPGDWVKYYSKGRNLIEQVIEVMPGERVDRLVLPSGQVVDGKLELDIFPATMVTAYIPED